MFIHRYLIIAVVYTIEVTIITNAHTCYIVNTDTIALGGVLNVFEQLIYHPSGV